MLLVDSHPLETPQENFRRIDLAPFVWFCKRRGRMIAAIAGGFVLAVLAMTILTPKSYTTTAQVIVGNPAGPAPADTQQASDLPVLNAFLTASMAQSPETYAALFQQVPVADDVVKMLKLRATGSALLGHIAVVPVTNTSLLNVSATWSDRATSAAIANAFANAVIARQRDLVASQANSAVAFLSQELPKARETAQRTNMALASYSAAHHLPTMDSDTQTTLSTLASLDTRANEAKIAEQQASAQLASAQKQLKSLPAQIVGSTQVNQNPVTAQLQVQLAQNALKLRDARAKYTERHPVVAELEAQQRSLQKEIDAQNAQVVAGTSHVVNPVYQQVQGEITTDQAQVSSAQATLAEIDRQRNSLEPQLAALPRQSVHFTELMRASKSAQAVYTALESKLNDANVARSTALSDVTLTAPASPQEATIRPRLLFNLIIALIVGSFLALVTALLFDLADGSLIDARRVERDLQLPVIASIPDVPKQVSGARAVALQDSTIDAFVGLASLLKFAPGDMRTIAITSAAHAEGRSTVSLNLSLALGELGERVLLIDASHTRRVTSVSAAGKREAGFYEVLDGSVSLRDAVRRTREERVDVLNCGNPKQSLRLLAPGRIEKLIEQARAHYKYIVFDAPAICDGIETALLLRSIGRWLMVVCDGVTNLTAARTAVASMRRYAGENVAGTVINRVDVEGRKASEPPVPAMPMAIASGTTTRVAL